VINLRLSIRAMAKKTEKAATFRVLDKDPDESAVILEIPEFPDNTQDKLR